MNDYYQFKEDIKKLLKAWNDIIKPHIEKGKEYGETNTRKYIIDPILEALNWVDDGSKKIVDNEFSIKHPTGTGSADYALKVRSANELNRTCRIFYPTSLIRGAIKICRNLMSPMSMAYPSLKCKYHNIFQLSWRLQF